MHRVFLFSSLGESLIYVSGVRQPIMTVKLDKLIAKYCTYMFQTAFEAESKTDVCFLLCNVY